MVRGKKSSGIFPTFLSFLIFPLSLLFSPYLAFHSFPSFPRGVFWTKIWVDFKSQLNLLSNKNLKIEEKKKKNLDNFTESR